MDISLLITESNLEICANIQSSMEASLAKIGLDYQETITGVKHFEDVIKKLIELELFQKSKNISEFVHKFILIPFLAKLCQALNRKKNNQCSYIWNYIYITKHFLTNLRVFIPFQQSGRQ